MAELARGGMGVVYRALDPRLEREVALKVIPREWVDADSLSRFKAEAVAAARLRHPNIVGLLDVGLGAGGEPYLVMELVQGESLQARIERAGPFEAREAARIALALAESLAFAHARDVLHRDLKPHNVLLDERGDVRLTDFGLAKLLDQDMRLTRTGEVLGTPVYMSPEQVNGDLVDARTDVYGLGAILYAMLCGQPPYEAKGVIQALNAVVSAPPLPPREVVAGVDPELEAICQRCLASDPGERFPTMSAVVAALVGGGPGSSPAPSRARPLGLLALGGGAGILIGVAAALLAGPQRSQPAQPEPVATATPDTDRPSVEALLEASRACSEERPQVALELVRAAIQRAPHSGEARLLEAKVHAQLDAYEPMRRAIEEAERLGAEPFDVALARGEFLVCVGKAEEAMVTLRLAVGLRPASARARKLLGIVLFNLGRAGEAKESLELALKQDPANPLVLSNLAWVLTATGQNREAIQHFDRVIALDSGQKEVYGKRGWAHLQLGLFGKALADFDFELRRAPDDGRSLLGLGVCLQQARPPQHTKALVPLTRGLKVVTEPDQLQGLRAARAMSRAQLGLLKEAEQDLNSCRDQGDPMVLLARGLIAYKRKRFEQALSHLKPLREIPGPTGRNARWMRAQSLKQLRRWSEAAGAYEELAREPGASAAEQRKAKEQAERLRRGGGRR